jgi:hypothetical protein
MRNSNRNYQTQNNFNKSENISKIKQLQINILYQSVLISIYIAFHSKDNQDSWRRNQKRNQSESENKSNFFKFMKIICKKSLISLLYHIYDLYFL